MRNTRVVRTTGTGTAATPAAGTFLLIPMLVLMLAAPAAAAAQIGAPSNQPETVEPLKLSGPRFGLTVLSSGIRDRAANELGETIGPVISQFGWQWETRFFSIDGGPTGVSEWVLLVGGLEQSLFLPSLTWIVGLRSSGGAEVGVGPNVTAAGAALAIAGGITVQNGPIFFPINVAVVPSKSGLRASLLAGFNMRRASAARAAAVPAPSDGAASSGADAARRGGFR